MLGLDDPQAFPTEAAFVAAWQFTGTMKPLARRSEQGDHRACLLDDDGDE